jgi:hypothetical protein
VLLYHLTGPKRMWVSIAGIREGVTFRLSGLLCLACLARLRPARLRPARLRPARLRPARLRPARLRPARLCPALQKTLKCIADKKGLQGAEPALRPSTITWPLFLRSSARHLGAG